MAYGADYLKALSDWNGLSERDRLISKGATPNNTGDDAMGLDMPEWWNQSSRADLLKFDSQKYWGGLGVIPFDPSLRGDGSGQTYTPEQSLAFNNQNAASYGLGDYNNMLKRMTGAGQFVSDPDIGQVWEPQNRDSQTWDINFVGAQNKDRGFVNNFFDSGAAVKALGGLVFGAGATDFFNGGIDSFKNIFNGWTGGAPAATGTGAASMPTDYFNPDSWLDEVFNVDPGGAPAGTGGGLPEIPDWQRDYFKDFTPGTFDGPGSPVAGDLTGLTGNNNVQEIIKKVIQSGGAGNSNIGKLLQSLGLPAGISDFVGGAAQTAPVLAALNYARNQNPINTAGLEGLARTYSPEAQAVGYDLQTGQGRNQLTSSLTNRGVAGSSFGNFDMASYDTLRGLGRSNLINQGAGTQAGIYGLINSGNLEAQKMKNQLLGSGLNALGLMASPNRGVTLPGYA